MKLNATQITLASMMPVGIPIACDDIQDFPHKQKVLDALVRKGVIVSDGYLYTLPQGIDGARHYLPPKPKKRTWEWPAHNSYCMANRKPDDVEPVEIVEIIKPVEPPKTRREKINTLNTMAWR